MLPLETLLASCNYRESRAQESWWDCSGLDHTFEGSPLYTNAPMMVFESKAESGSYRRPFCLNCGFFVDNTENMQKGQWWLQEVVLLKLCFF